MKKLILSLLFVMIVSGCSANSKASLGGKTFSLDGTNITLGFDKSENKFYGKAVNNYFGVYTKDDAMLKLELQGSTMMMGSADEMAQEVKYFNDINKVTSYSINGNVLTLKGGNVELNFTETK